MSWNPALNLYQELKNEYSLKYGSENLWNYAENDNCLNYWANSLKNIKYLDIVNHCKIIEYNGFLLIHYGRFDEIFKDVDYDSFWDKYGGLFRECRSVVIDIRNDCLALTPYGKFFNLNEMPETSEQRVRIKINMAEKIEVSNKLDGSMVSARWYNGRLLVSTSSALDPQNSWRLAYAYEWFDNHNDYIELLYDYPQSTFIFEMIHPQDIHCVQYNEDMIGLHLIGARQNNGWTAPYDIIRSFAKVYHLMTTEVLNMTFDEVLASLGDKQCNEAEGYVVNIDGFRVKIKFDDFVKMHGMLKKLAAPNLILEAIRNDNFDDAMSKIPAAYRVRAYKIATNIVTWIDNQRYFVEMYGKIAKTFDNRKDAMIWIKNNVPKERQGKVRSYYLNQEIDYLRGVKYYQILEGLGKENDEE